MVKFFEPHEIEKQSMAIITKELNGRTWPEPMFSIVRRCIHTSADFDYADNLRFSPGAEILGVKLLRGGCNIVTDTKMAFAGINKNRLESYGGKAYCFISDEDVIAESKERGCTRATVAMRRVQSLKDRPSLLSVMHRQH